MDLLEPVRIFVVCSCDQTRPNLLQPVEFSLNVRPLVECHNDLRNTWADTSFYQRSCGGVQDDLG